MTLRAAPTLAPARAFGSPRFAIRQAAARAFRMRQLGLMQRSCTSGLRPPELGETPLSPSEIEHGVRMGVIR